MELRNNIIINILILYVYNEFYYLQVLEMELNIIIIIV